MEVFCKRGGQECERKDFFSPACERVQRILTFGRPYHRKKYLVEAATDTISSRTRDIERMDEDIIWLCTKPRMMCCVIVVCEDDIEAIRKQTSEILTPKNFGVFLGRGNPQRRS